MCGDNVKLLNVYISRKKVILHDSSGKLVDTDNLINLLYKKKRQEINKSKKEDSQIINNILPNPRKNKKQVDDDGDDDLPPPLDQSFITEAMSRGKRDSSGDMNQENMQGWIRKKMKGDAELVALKVEKEQLLLDKAAGKLVPVDVAANVLRSQAKTIFANMENALENIATVFCNIMAGGNMDMYTRIVEAGRLELGKSISRAGIDAKDDLEKIITDYSDTRASKF